MLMVFFIGHHGVDIDGDSDVDCEIQPKRFCPFFVISSTSEVVFRNLKSSSITNDVAGTRVAAKVERKI